MPKNHMAYQGETLCQSRSLTALIGNDSCAVCDRRMERILRAALLAVQKAVVNQRGNFEPAITELDRALKAIGINATATRQAE